MIRASLLVGLALCVAAGSAQAEPKLTAWLSAAGGGAVERGRARGVRGAGVFTTAVGAGAALGSDVFVGGLFRSTTYFQLGTELALGPRLQLGSIPEGFTISFDLGVALRTYEHSQYGRVPLQGGAAVCFHGLLLELGGRFGDLSGRPSAAGGYLVLGVDLLQLVFSNTGGSAGRIL